MKTRRSLEKSLKTAALLSMLLAGCVVNPDADKVLREEQRRADSVAAAEKGVVPVTPDTGQYAMPVAPIAPGDMPVVDPADSAAAEAK